MSTAFTCIAIFSRLAYMYRLQVTVASKAKNDPHSGATSFPKAEGMCIYRGAQIELPHESLTPLHPDFVYLHFSARRQWFPVVIVHVEEAYNNTVALATASASSFIRRFSTPRVRNLHSQSAQRYRTSPIQAQRRLYASDKIPSGGEESEHQREQTSTIGLLRDLLSEGVPESITHEEDVSQIVATLEAKRHWYLPQESPTERWRRRNVLGARKGDASLRISYLSALSGVEQIIFKQSHKAKLQYSKPAQLEASGQPDHSRYIMHSHLQILTTPTADTPGTTLLLHFDNKRYLVGNLAEGTQRACVQMGARLAKVSEAFLTGRTEWDNTGGLIGIILTLADGAASSAASNQAEAKKRALTKAKRLGVLHDEEKMQELMNEASRENSTRLTLFGPPNLNHTLATARRFVFRKGLPLDVHEIDESTHTPAKGDDWAPYWTDENIKVWAMPILPSTASSDGTFTGASAPPLSSRKRSIDEVYNGHSRSRNIDPVVDDLSEKDRDQLTCKAVVAEMFDSSWRLDSLYETPLSQVRLPATLFVRNAKSGKIEKYRGPFAPAHPGTKFMGYDPDLKVLVRRPWPGALVEYLPSTKPAKEAISYIIRNHTQRGKFHADRAIALKVAKGQNWGKLTRGEDVLNIDGETITPDMVLGESKEGGGVAVVDLPEESYIEALLSRREWREENIMVGVGAVFWILGPGVLRNEKIKKFMSDFKHLQHVVSSPDVCANGIALDSAAAATTRLRQVDPARYTVPVHDVPSSKPPQGFTVAARGQKIQLEPSVEVDSKQIVPPLSISDTEAETSQDVLDEAQKAQDSIQSLASELTAWKSTLPPDAHHAEIVTLGTGSALPSKYRNVSATLLRVPGWGSMLFDCGENTLGQLRRVFAPAELKQVLRELRIIFISHMHADHHLGTVSVIKAWYAEKHQSQPLPKDADLRTDFTSSPGLAVVSEPAMQHWLAEYAAVEDYGHSRIAPVYISVPHSAKVCQSKLGWFCPPSELAALSKEDYVDRLEKNTVSPGLLGLENIQAVAVQHCHGAKAVSITFKPSAEGSQPFKVSYSGDCRPSRAFSLIGKGSTVCIHEATFDDELIGDARAKNHSTTSEALGVAQAMGAKACVLTHFSQRYQKLPVLEHGTNGEGGAVTDSVPLFNDSEGEEEDAENMEDDAGGPLEDAAATFPDQGTQSNGQQYDLSRSHEAGSADPQVIKLTLASDMRVCVAFDYMRVKVGEIAELEKFTPALLKLFAQEDQPDGMDIDGVVAANGDTKKPKKAKAERRKA